MIRRIVLSVSDWRTLVFIVQRSAFGQSIRARFGRLRFRVQKYGYGGSEYWHRAILGAGATWGLVRLSVAPVLAACVITGALVLLEKLHGLWHAEFSWIPTPLTVSESAYTQLMSIVAQIAAAILALFFAAISVVTSTSYAKVTSEIRAVVAHDDWNRRYLRLLAHLAAVALIAMGLQTAGNKPSAFLTVYTLAISAIAVLAFLPLGLRTFSLFDTANLCGHPLRRFVRALETVIASEGPRWLEPSFQRHANAVAENQLQLLSDLIAFEVAQDRPRHTNISDITAAYHQLARYYATKKSEIPSGSLWFSKKAEFKRWETSSSSVTDLALRAGITLPADLVPDHLFLERKCAEVTAVALQHLLVKGAESEAVRVLSEVGNTADILARLYAQQEALTLLAASRRVLLPYLQSSRRSADMLQVLQLVDLHCYAAIAPVLNPALTLVERPLDAALKSDDAVLSLKRRTIYLEPHPRTVVESLEDLVLRIEFEAKTEGRLYVQRWYVRQIIAIAYAESIRTIAGRMVEALKAEFIAPAEELVRNNQALIASVWLQRALEACQKAAQRLGALAERHESLRTLVVTKAKWTPFDAETQLEKVEEVRRHVILLLARTVPSLCEIRAGESLPDVLGQIRAWLAEELISLMDKKESGAFSELFRAYFNASLAVYGNLLEIAKQPRREDLWRAAVSPLIDLMEISGIAFLFSEVDGTLFRQQVSEAWDAYFEGTSKKLDVIKGWYATLESEFALPILSPNAMQRQRWEKQLADALVERGVKKQDELGFRGYSEDRKPHPNAVVESLHLTFGHPSIRPYAYFGALYIAARPEAVAIPMPRVIENCNEAIALAKKRIAQHGDGTKQ